jgi:hypothetical protein
MAESKSAALPLGDAPMPLFIPGCRLLRPDHNARQDKPQPRLAGSTKITTGGPARRNFGMRRATEKARRRTTRRGAASRRDQCHIGYLRCVEISLAGVLGRSMAQFTTPVNPHGLLSSSSSSAPFRQPVAKNVAFRYLKKM